MRLSFRIAIYEGDRKLKKADFKDKRDPLSVGMRYVTEYKYLEATKWLMIAPDCWEKYILLGLINLALGQEQQGWEFLLEAKDYPRATSYGIALEKPQAKL